MKGIVVDGGPRSGAGIGGERHSPAPCVSECRTPLIQPSARAGTLEVWMPKKRAAEEEEDETEKKVITLEMIYEELQGVKRMLDETCRERESNDKDRQGQRGGIEG